MDPPRLVRAPADSAEVRAAFAAEGDIFLDGDAERAEQWRDRVQREPSHDRQDIRAVFDGDRCLGVALIHRRTLRLHDAAVPTLLVGGVGVRAEHRGQGLGSALMRDVEQFGRRQGFALSLLIGAHLFYDPFGYVDIFDPVRHQVARTEIEALDRPEPAPVRPATPDDAAAVLALYTEHYAGYGGSLQRSVAEQRVFLELAIEEFARLGEHADGAGPRVALDANGAVTGYTAFAPGVNTWLGCEVAARDAAAVHGLLRAHAALPPAPDGDPDHVAWCVPPDSLTGQLLTDLWPVCSTVRSQPSAGWMATSPRPGDLLSTLAERWSRPAARPAADLTLRVADHTARIPGRRRSAATATVTASTLLPLLFGYRTGSWARAQPDSRIDDAAVSILDDLMRRGRPWLAPSDGR